MSDRTVSCPAFGCSIREMNVLAKEPAFGGEVDTDLKEQQIRTIGNGMSVLSAFVCNSCHSIAGIESYPKYGPYESNPPGVEYSNTRHCPACGAETTPQIGRSYRNRLFDAIEIQIGPVGCPECDAIIGTAPNPKAAPTKRPRSGRSKADPLPYRCPGCDRRDRPRYVTWPMESHQNEVLGVGVACRTCDRLWGGAVVVTDFESEMLAGDNLYISREVTTADSDFEGVYQESQDIPFELTEGQSSGYTCRHCGEDVDPQSGWIPAADGQSVLSVVTEYCPACEAVLGVTWG